MKFMQIAVLAVGVALSGGAAAHSDEYLETVQAPHGGQLRMAGPYHYELVIKPGTGGTNDVLVYLTDHGGAAVATEGATGSVVVLSKSKSTVALKPDGKNTLRGSGSFEIGPNLKAVVAVTLPGKPAEQARFSPFSDSTAARGSRH